MLESLFNGFLWLLAIAFVYLCGPIVEQNKPSEEEIERRRQANIKSWQAFHKKELERDFIEY